MRQVLQRSRNSIDPNLDIENFRTLSSKATQMIFSVNAVAPIELTTKIPHIKIKNSLGIGNPEPTVAKTAITKTACSAVSTTHRTTFKSSVAFTAWF